MANLNAITTPDGTTYNLTDSRVDNIFGGTKKVVAGHNNVSRSSSTECKVEVTTGLTSIDYMVATFSHTAAGTNYPTANTYGPPSLYCRKNYPSDGKATISAYGTSFSGSHAIPVDWIAIGT